MSLQERIEELGSGILEITESEVKLIGFTCEERLKDFYEKNCKCFSSNGIYTIYKEEKLDFSKIRDNALFIKKINGKEVARYQFEPLFIIKGEDKFRYTEINSLGEKKQKSKVFTIRKCKYTNKYNFRDMQKSILFDSFDELNEYIRKNFNNDLKEMFFIHHYVDNNLFTYKDLDINNKYFYSKKEVMEFVFKKFGKILTSKDIIRNKSIPKGRINRVLAIDFETANEDQRSICSVGIALAENNEIVFNKEFLINPEEKFDPSNINIHNITEEDVKDKPTFPEVWNSIKGLIDTHTLVIAHNTAFDMTALIKACKKYKINTGSFKYLCTLRASRKMFTNLESYSLNKIADYLNIEFTHHKAKDDALVCLEIFNHMTKDLEELTVTSIEKKLQTDIRDIKNTKEIPENHNLNLEEVNRYKNIFKKKVDIDSIKPQYENIDTNNPVNGFVFVFTGDLKKFKSKADAMQQVVNLGGKLGKSVTKSTDYLVCGETDLQATRGKEKSSKRIKAEDYINKGISIKIINEDELIELLNSRYEEVSLDLEVNNHIDETKLIKTIAPKEGAWAKFLSEEDKIHRLKNFKLLPPKVSTIDREFYYKGAYIDKAVICDIVGYMYRDNDILVIKIRDKLHCIRGEYLKQMQDKNFNKFQCE